MTHGWIPYLDLPGWFNWQDTYRRWSEEVSPSGTIVEVGVHCGRSLGFLLNELCANRGLDHLPRVYAVDVWEDMGAYETFMKHFGAAQVAVIRQPSTMAAKYFNSHSVEYVWIDAAHDYNSVSADLAAWWPKVTREMGGHDYGFPGVKKAVQEFAKREGLRVEVLPSSTKELHMPSWLVRR